VIDDSVYRNSYARKTSTFRSLLKNLYFHKQLIFRLAQREIFTRYQSSLLGIGWAFITPIITLFVYTIFFSIFLKARWTGFENGYTNYALILFVGLLIHGLFAECLARAPHLILLQPNYVKKVVSPIELFPCVAMLSSLFHLTIGFIILIVAQLILNHWLSWTIVFLPILFAPFIILMLGLMWFLSALGVYMRDISQIVTHVTMIALFMSPVFYPLSNLPASVQPWLFVNPLTFIVEQARQIFFYAAYPDWLGIGIYFFVSILTAYIGLWWFQRTREGFADVL